MCFSIVHHVLRFISLNLIKIIISVTNVMPNKMAKIIVSAVVTVDLFDFENGPLDGVFPPFGSM